MKLFSYDAIKEAGDCLAYARDVLGMQEVKPGRFHCPWRPDSDSAAFAVDDRGWHDHVTKESGSIIDLVARVRHNGDMMSAQQELGEHYSLTPASEVKPSRKIVKVYDYLDLNGKLVHQTIRYEPKEFSQRRPDPDNLGKWKWDLNGIATVLYRWPEWHDSSWVILCEGEKDADNLAELGLPATTVAMGAGKWSKHHSEAVRGKRLAIVPDVDGPGRGHAVKVAQEVDGIASEVRIVQLPDGHKDVSDWLEAGGSKKELMALIKSTPGGVPADFEAPEKKDLEALELAKRSNQTPFANYTLVDVTKPNGKTKPEKRPRTVRELMADLRNRFLGFPARVGSTLFDHDRDRDEIREIDNQSALFAWIGEKSKHPVNWTRIEGSVSQRELYEAVLANARYYESISGVPSWPIRDDVYYTHGKMPDPDPEAFYFREFCDFFLPATSEDAALIRVLVASVLFHHRDDDRPLWIIESTAGQGSGKSIMIQKIAQLYGGDDLESGSPIDVAAKALQNETQQERLYKRVLSRGGRAKRILLIDNVTGHFVCPELASMITMRTISGMAPYGRGEENRPNDLTYVVTSNSATFDTDLAERAMFLFLKKPPNDPTWSKDVSAFISENRLQIIADIIGMIKQGPGFDYTPVTRFAGWEHQIMVPMIGTESMYERVWKKNLDRRAAADSEKNEAEDIRERILEGLRELNINPETTAVWLHSEAVTLWVRDVMQISQRSAMTHLKNWAKNGSIPELDDYWSAWPHRSTGGIGRKRGIGWLTDQGQREPEQVVSLNRKGRGSAVASPVL